MKTIKTLALFLTLSTAIAMSACTKEEAASTDELLGEDVNELLAGEVMAIAYSGFPRRATS